METTKTSLCSPAFPFGSRSGNEDPSTARGVMRYNKHKSRGLNRQTVLPRSEWSFIYSENEKAVSADIRGLGTVSTHDTQVPVFVFSAGSVGRMGTGVCPLEAA